MRHLASEPPDRGAIRKYNPGTLQFDEEVIGQFVVRERELRIVLEVLCGNVDSPSCQHVLLVAPRGRGKTMLLARIAAALRTEDALSRHLLPVRFMEESQEIFDLADFWLEALFYLAMECALLDPGLARELRATHDDLSARGPGHPVEEHARCAVLEAADRLGRKLVLMVENLQSLSDDVEADFGWKLREVLQSEPQIVLLGTATSRFDGLDDATQPFFELFRIVGLPPFTTDECRRLVQTVSGDAVNIRETRPLEILTGGSPRLLVIVAEFARPRSLARLVEDLVKLIDDHTEYFRSHLDAIPKTERRVYLAVIDLWQPSSSGEIAARSRLEIRTVSTMLGRLIARGAVVADGSGRKRRYAAAERLYSIYYKLRRERDEATVVHSLVRFMSVFYGNAQLAKMSDGLISEAGRSLAIRDGIRRAMEELPHVDAFSGRGWLALRHASNEADTAGECSLELSSGETETEETIEAARQLLEVIERSGLDESEAEAACDELIERFGDSDADEVRTMLAKALVHRGAAVEGTGEVRTAIKTYGEVAERFGDSDVPSLHLPTACALVKKGEALGRIGETGPALAIYDEVIERFGDGAAAEHREQAARALVAKARLQWRTGEPEAAIATCEAVVERFGDNESRGLRIEVAEALRIKAMIHEQMGQFGAVTATCNAVVERFEYDDAPELRAQAASALLYMGVAHLHAGDFEAILSSCDEVVERFGASEVTEDRIPVALALVINGAVQGLSGDAAAAVAACDEAVDRFGDSDARELRTLAALALAVKVTMLGMAGETAAVAAACDELTDRYGHDDVRELRALVAGALAIRRVAQGTLSTSQAVIAVCDDVIDLFRDDDTRELQAMVSVALTVNRAMEGQIGQPEAVIQVCGILTDLFGGDGMSEPHALVAMTLLVKGAAQEKLNQPDASIKTFDELIGRFGDSDAPIIKELVAIALACKGERQVGTGCPLQALQTCEDLERRLSALTGRQTPALEWRAAWLRTQAHLAQGERLAAMDAFRRLYAVFLPGDEEMMSEMLARVPELIAAGAAERDIVDILSSDHEKSGVLLPLVVALRMRSGESVRAPAEVIEVASDIRKGIESSILKSSN